MRILQGLEGDEIGIVWVTVEWRINKRSNRFQDEMEAGFAWLLTRLGARFGSIQVCQNRAISYRLISIFQGSLQGLEYWLQPLKFNVRSIFRELLLCDLRCGGCLPAVDLANLVVCSQLCSC